MPTKPTLTVELFAANDTWSVGPKIGQLTKSVDIGQLASEGAVPGKPNPTAGNDINRALFNMSSYDIWTSLGTFVADLDAHIVETDGLGSIFVASSNFGGTESATSPSRITSNQPVTNPGNVPNVRIIATDQVGMIITSTRTLSAVPASLAISNSATAVSKWACESISTGGGGDSIGGGQFECNSNRTTGSTSSVFSRRVAAMNLINRAGVGLEVITDDITLPGATILNTADLGTSLQVGYGINSSPVENFAGNAIDARGGDGDATSGIGGGTGVIGTGGDAKDGVSDASGGVGVRAIGGLSATLPAAPACLVESKGVNGIGLQVDHLNVGATADLAKLTTGDNVANGLVVNCQGFGAGVKVDAEGGYGLDITQTPESGGSTIRSAIHIEPQVSPSATSDGDIWAEAFAGMATDQLAFKGATVDQTVCRTQQPFCKLTHFSASGTQATTTTFVDQATMAFEVPVQPTGATKVILKAWGQLNLNGTDETNICQTRWRDDTAAVDVDTKSHDGAGSSTVRKVEVFHMREYTIPAGGPRTFKFQYNIESGATMTTIDAINWWFEIESIPEV